jgi:hypothetical protein
MGDVASKFLYLTAIYLVAFLHFLLFLALDMLVLRNLKAAQ